LTKKFDIKVDKNWSLFLDRDGVINKRILGGYITTVSDFEFIPGVLESIKYFTTVFNRVLIVTNQQGIGKGLMTEYDLENVHSFMLDGIRKTGGDIDSIYYCPDLSDTKANCRKPSIAMANRAIADFPEICPEKSIMVGDTKTDMIFGRNSGMKTIFVNTKLESNKDIDSDFTIDGLLELKYLIQNNLRI
jgi:D-glycero-D-manno-heptose 1,7-bisphosphate phosphatase